MEFKLHLFQQQQLLLLHYTYTVHTIQIVEKTQGQGKRSTILIMFTLIIA